MEAQRLCGWTLRPPKALQGMGLSLQFCVVCASSALPTSESLLTNPKPAQCQHSESVKFMAVSG